MLQIIYNENRPRCKFLFPITQKKTSRRKSFLFVFLTHYISEVSTVGLLGKYNESGGALRFLECIGIRTYCYVLACFNVCLGCVFCYFVKSELYCHFNTCIVVVKVECATKEFFNHTKFLI